MSQSQKDKQEAIKKVQDAFFFVGDKFCAPLSAAMCGVYFPTGHAKILEQLRDLIKEELPDTPGTPEVITSLNEIIGNLKSPDIGASKGFKCIYDHRDAFEVAMNKFTESLHKESQP